MENINFIQGIPKYKQIAGHIKLAVIGGQIKPGDKMPTARQYSTVLEVNIATVARAYTVLRREGFLIVRRKFGTMVVKNPEQRLVILSRQSLLAVMTDKIILETLSQGYSPEELENTLHLKIKQVKKIKVK